MAYPHTLTEHPKRRTRPARRSRYLARSWPLYVMVVPGLVILALFHYYPMYGVVAAFQAYNPGLGFSRSPWVGFLNFELVFQQPQFPQLLRNTVVIAVAKIVVIQAFGVAFALMLNEVRQVLFKRAAQTLVYLPHFFSWIVLGGILLDLLGFQGLLNRFLGLFDLGPYVFLGDNRLFQPTLVLTELWKEGGWATIVFLAALTSIPPELYESAAIDGASRWRQTLYITLPGLLPMVLLIAALNLGNVLNAGFEQVLTLYNPAVYPTGDIIDTWVYRTGLLSAQYSLATAVGLFKSLIGLVLTVFAYVLIHKYSRYRVF